MGGYIYNPADAKRNAQVRRTKGQAEPSYSQAEFCRALGGISASLFATMRSEGLIPEPSYNASLTKSRHPKNLWQKSVVDAVAKRLAPELAARKRGQYAKSKAEMMV